VERRGHPVAIFFALVLAALVGVVAIFSIWANDQLLDTGSWGSVSGRLLENKQVRGRVADFLGEELSAQTESQLLASGQEGIAAEVMPRLRAQQTELAERVMATKQFRKIWEAANRAGHRALLRVLENEGDEGAVQVDLTPALRQVADELGETGFARELGVADLGELVEPGAARIKVLEGQELRDARDAVRVVRHLTVPAVLIALALYAIALILGRARLARTLFAVGLALVATGLLALLARTLFGHAVVDGLLGIRSDRDAAEAAWRVATSKVSDLAGWAIGIGAVIVLLDGGWALARRTLGSREPA
jgi:hypothetical protein